MQKKTYEPPRMIIVPIRCSDTMLTGSAMSLNPVRSDLLNDDYHNIAYQYEDESSSGWDNFFGDALEP